MERQDGKAEGTRKKERTRTSTRYPELLVLDNRDGVARCLFTRREVEDILPLVQTFPIYARWARKGYALYVDERGMHEESYTTNDMAYPFMESRTLFWYMQMGYPLGPVVVERKGGHIEEELLDIFSSYDRVWDDEEGRAMYYTDMIREAMKKWDETEKNVSRNIEDE